MILDQSASASEASDLRIGEVDLIKCNSGRALIVIIRLRAAGWLLSREIDVVVAGAACSPVGSLRKAAACAAPVV